MALLPLEDAKEAILARVREVRGEKNLIHDFEVQPSYFTNHKGQEETWFATESRIAVFAGWQSGKSVTGPPWLIREIQRCGDGDYAVLAPTAPLLRKKALPELLRFLRSCLEEDVDFEFKRGDMEIHFLGPGQIKFWGEIRGETKIYLGHAMDPNAVEAFTAKAIWIDEPGQIPDESWEAIQARVAVNEGRILMTSRPYKHNWYVTQVWNKKDEDPDTKVINYSSLMNPAFPPKEYYRQKGILPAWKFRMKYDGIPTRPAGAIYDCFEQVFEDEDGNPLPPRVEKCIDDEGEDQPIVMLGKNVCKPFKIPAYWRRSSGHDFGPRNTAACFAAQDPHTGKLYIYRSYHAGEKIDGKVSPGKSTAGHIQAFVKRWQSNQSPNAWGGSPSEEKTRIDFAKHGWPIQAPPIVDIIEGITRVYSMLKTGLLVVFDDLEGLIQEFLSYSWKLDEEGEPLEDDAKNIENGSTFHRLDTVRYLCAAVYEGVAQLMQVAERLEDSTDEVTYEAEEEEFNAFAHLGWKLTPTGWIQTGEEYE